MIDPILLSNIIFQAEEIVEKRWEEVGPTFTAAGKTKKMVKEQFFEKVLNELVFEGTQYEIVETKISTSSK
ncbi:hypothetical protein ACFFGV_06770 [Pontibacillus salicampi]|uniref:Uncharacterized protein n=1 Tax=Pontibacillus salicampi TaxID=1449801 RepID=A0ABV6LLK3_9BACI